MPVCDSCGSVTPLTWKFCRYCGSPAVAVLSFDGLVAGLIRESSDIFVPSEETRRTSLILRVPLARDADLTGRAVAIQTGQQAVIIRTNVAPEVIGPQTFPLSGNASPDSEDSQILLFRQPSTPLEIEIPDLLSQDPLPVTIRCSLVVEIENPATFSSEVFREGDIYTSAHLTDWIYGVVEKICKKFMASQVVRDSRVAYSMAEAIRAHIASLCDPAIQEFGLHIGDVQDVSVHCPSENGSWGQTEGILVSQLGGAENQSIWSQSIDSMPDSEVQTLSEETVFLARSKGRAAVWERLLRRAMCTSRTSMPAIEQLGQMVREADVDSLIDPSEVHHLSEMLDVSSSDPWRSKAFLIQRLSILRDHEKVNAGLIREYCLSEERLGLEFQHAARNLETRWEQDKARISLEIDERRESLSLGSDVSEKGLSSLQQSTHLEDSRSSSSLETRQAALEHTVENGLRWYERYRTIRRDDELEKKQAEVDLERERQSLAIEKERAQLDMRLEESAQAHKHDLEKIDSLSQAGIADLIGLPALEQGKLLVQLSRTRALSRLTPDEILSLCAARSPSVGEALREVLTAVTSAGNLHDYEMMISGHARSVGTLDTSPSSKLPLDQLISQALDEVSQEALVRSAPVWMLSRPSAIPSEVAPDGTVTLLFSDIKGSTDITERLGDRSAQALFGVHNSIIRDRLKEFNGYEVKSMGDGFMLAFSSVRTGIMCAVAIQLDLRLHNDGYNSEPIRVRMGLHTGEVVKEGADYFGKNVILASRISALAQEEQVLVSSLSKGLVDSLQDFKFEDPMTVSLKGLAGSTVVYPVKYGRDP